MVVYADVGMDPVAAAAPHCQTNPRLCLPTPLRHKMADYSNNNVVGKGHASSAR